MGADLYAQFSKAKEIFDRANEILGLRFTERLFNATELELMDPRFNQLGIFLYQVALAVSQNEIKPDCVAGHSLGEYAALVVAGVLNFEDVVRFLKIRGEVLHDSFNRCPGAMAAIIGVEDEVVKKVLEKVSEDSGYNVYIANYNGPGQLVISGERSAVKDACKTFKQLGAKRALILPQKGIGHTPNSILEGEILEAELRKLNWAVPHIPIYMDVDGLPHVDPAEIIENQVKLITHPVKWTDVVRNMTKDSVTEFYECGTDNTLQKIIARMAPNLKVTSIVHIPEYDGKINDYSFSI